MNPKFFRQYADILREFGADNGPIGVAGRQPVPAGQAPAAAQGTNRLAAIGGTQQGPNGTFSKTDASTGMKTLGGPDGTETIDTTTGATISRTSPTVGGMSQTTYTGSAGKGSASGAQTTSYNQGPVSVSQDTDAAGKATGSTAAYNMGNPPVTQKQGQQPVQEEDEDAELQRLKEFLSKPY